MRDAKRNASDAREAIRSIKDDSEFTSNDDVSRLSNSSKEYLSSARLLNYGGHKLARLYL